jgi:transcriptional regulator with XRE-family HTH domain
MGDHSASRAVIQSIGQRVRKLRKDRRLSQIVLAELAGVHYNTLKRIERGQGNPSVEALVRIAEALGAELTDLLRRE